MSSDPFETTSPPGLESSSPPSQPGQSSRPLASWAQMLADRVNLLAAIGAVLWSSKDLIALAKNDVRPLLGAGIILLVAALRFRPGDVVAAIKAWRTK